MGEVAEGASTDGSGDGMTDAALGGGEIGSSSTVDAEETAGDATEDAAIDGAERLGMGGAGGTGGRGEVSTGAGGKSADGRALDTPATDTGGTTPGTGGRWGTGGNPSSGGAMGSGGLAATGGTSTTGGNGGLGGSTGTGGRIGSGGAPATGGVAATGGMVSTGGASGTGGTSSAPCSGVRYAGICWYLGAPGSSCAQTCTGHGGPSALAVSHVGTVAQGGSLAECASVLSHLGVAGTVQNVSSTSGVGCSKNVGSIGPGPGVYWCTTPDFSATASLDGVQPACGCVQ